MGKLGGMADKLSPPSATAPDTTARTPAGGSTSAGSPQAASPAELEVTDASPDGLARFLLDAKEEAPARSPKAEQAKSADPEDEDETDDVDPDADEDETPEAADGEEAEAEEEETPEVEAEEDEDEIKGLEELPKSLKRRFKELLTGRKEANAKVAELTSQIETLRTAPVPLTPTAAAPLAHITTLPDLDRQVESAKALRKFARENPDGFDGEIAGRTVSLSAEQVAAKLEEAENILDAAPDRRDVLKWRAEKKPLEMARKLAPPGVFDRPAPDQKSDYEALLEEVPGLAAVKDAELIAAMYFAGLQVITDNRSGKFKWTRIDLKTADKTGAKPTAKTKPPQPGARPPVKPVGRGAVKDLSALEAQAASGNEEDIAALLAGAFDN